jgi:hypothetical protein
MIDRFQTHNDVSQPNGILTPSISEAENVTASAMSNHPAHNDLVQRHVLAISDYSL